MTIKNTTNTSEPTTDTSQKETISPPQVKDIKAPITLRTVIIYTIMIILFIIIFFVTWNVMTWLNTPTN